MFTRTKRPTAAPVRKLAPVVAYNSPSAAVNVTGSGNHWALAVETTQGVSGVFTFTDRRAAVCAAQWLAYQDLTDIGSNVGPGLTWVQLVDAISDSRDTVITPNLADALPELTPDVIQHVLEVHYRQVLESKEGRRMWSKLLRDAATVEKAAQIRRDAR